MKSEFKKKDVIELFNLSESDYNNFTRLHNMKKSNPRRLFDKHPGTGNDITYSLDEMVIWYFAVNFYRNNIDPMIAKTALQNTYGDKVVLDYAPLGFQIKLYRSIAIDYIESYANET